MIEFKKNEDGLNEVLFQGEVILKTKKNKLDRPFRRLNKLIGMGDVKLDSIKITPTTEIVEGGFDGIDSILTYRRDGVTDYYKYICLQEHLAGINSIMASKEEDLFQNFRNNTHQFNTIMEESEILEGLKFYEMKAKMEARTRRGPSINSLLGQALNSAHRMSKELSNDLER